MFNRYVYIVSNKFRISAETAKANVGGAGRQRCMRLRQLIAPVCHSSSNRRLQLFSVALVTRVRSSAPAFTRPVQHSRKNSRNGQRLREKRKCIREELDRKSDQLTVHIPTRPRRYRSLVLRTLRAFWFTFMPLFDSNSVYDSCIRTSSLNIKTKKCPLTILSRLILIIKISKLFWILYVDSCMCCLQFSGLETPGYVGFANLPNQVHRKSVKKGFEFTLMVVGESGLGKSTLVNSLFLTDLYPERVIPDAIGMIHFHYLPNMLWIHLISKFTEKTNQTVKLDASTVEIEERGVKLRLTVVDTPGYGDAIDNTDCFQVIFTTLLFLY